MTDTKDEKKVKLHKFPVNLPPPPTRKDLNLEENLNKTQIIPAGTAFGNKGRGAGYYCEFCDLNFRDSLSWLDHLNSKQHLRAANQNGQIVRATLLDVQRKLESLRQAKRDEQDRDGNVDFWKRVEERKRIIALERKAKKEKRRLKKVQQQQQMLVGNDEDIASVMGFAGFNSSKA